jgi:hypothetical protein
MTLQEFIDSLTAHICVGIGFWIGVSITRFKPFQNSTAIQSIKRSLMFIFFWPVIIPILYWCVINEDNKDG